jgi:hypothetical protein
VTTAEEEAVLVDGPLLFGLPLFAGLLVFCCIEAEVEDFVPLPDFKYAALLTLDWGGWPKPCAALGMV